MGPRPNGAVNRAGIGETGAHACLRRASGRPAAPFLFGGRRKRRWRLAAGPRPAASPGCVRFAHAPLHRFARPTHTQSPMVSHWCAVGVKQHATGVVSAMIACDAIDSHPSSPLVKFLNALLYGFRGSVVLPVTFACACGWATGAN